MRLSVPALTITAAVLWGGGMLFVGVVNLAAPSYGLGFLQIMSSVYPGFHASRTLGDVLVGTGYATVDGAICGLLFAGCTTRSPPEGVQRPAATRKICGADRAHVPGEGVERCPRRGRSASLSMAMA
jgi:hypothetical protein